MKRKLCGIIAVMVIIGFSFAACGGGDDDCTHAWDWVVIKAATDFGDGERTETCSKCKETRAKETVLASGMVQIPAGTFEMGPDIWNNNATFTATVSAFKMGKYEVTQEQYQAVMVENPSYFTTANSRAPDDGEIDAKRPVETVSWYDAIIFCNKLSIKEGLSPVYKIDGSTNPAEWGEDAPYYDYNTGQYVEGDAAKWNAVEIVSGSTGYRLPTDAQWEYACRAGSDTDYYFSDEVSELENYAWYSANGGSKTHEVGKKLPNAFGLYDMHGNVWEWCWDWWGNYPTEAQADYRGAVSGTYRVERGGCWSNSAGTLVSAFRYYYFSYGRDSAVGFRVARP